MYRGRIKIYDINGRLLADKTSKQVFKTRKAAENNARKVGHYELMSPKYPAGSHAVKYAEKVHTAKTPRKTNYLGLSLLGF